MTYVALIALAVGGIASGIFAALWQGAKGALIKERAEHDKTLSDLAATTRGLQLSEAGRADEKARLESLVTSLKKEVDTLETNLPRDPGAVRSRLNELLGGVQPAVPVPSSGVGTSPLGLVPFGGAAKP